MFGKIVLFCLAILAATSMKLAHDDDSFDEEKIFQACDFWSAHLQEDMECIYNKWKGVYGWPLPSYLKREIT